MAFPILAVAALAAGSAIAGGIKASKAKKEAQRLAASRPQLSVSPYVTDQVRLAESELSRGQTSASQTAYDEALDRDFSSSIDAILRGGGSLGNIADVYGADVEGRSRMAMMEDNLRLNQIQNLMRAQGTGEDFRQQQFQFNQAAPWFDQAQAASAARAAGNKQMWDSIGSLGTAVGGMFSGGGWNTGGTSQQPSAVSQPTFSNGINRTDFNTEASNFRFR